MASSRLYMFFIKSFSRTMILRLSIICFIHLLLRNNSNVILYGDGYCLQSTARKSTSPLNYQYKSRSTIISLLI